MADAIQRLEGDVSNLKQDMAQVGALVDRLDVTIEKLTEVSTTVSQLLAVQGSRLEFQEKVQEKLQDLVEKRRVETDTAINSVYKRIEKVEEDLVADMADTENKIIKKIDELKTSADTQHNSMNSRMDRLEKWQWILIGGGSIIYLILSNINIGNLWG